MRSSRPTCCSATISNCIDGADRSREPEGANVRFPALEVFHSEWVGALSASARYSVSQQEGPRIDRAAVRPTSIILSPLRSRTALTVAWGLRANGIRVLCGPALSDAAFGPLSIAASPDDWIVHAPFGADVRSVWHYRPKAPALPPGTPAHECADVQAERLQFERTLCELAQQGLDALWVNEPRRTFEAENLLLQLRAARRAGIAFPETLVSSDPERVREFVERHAGAVCRRLVPNRVAAAGERDRFDVLNPLALSAVPHCPGIYQRRIESAGRIRVVVIGVRQFAARIDDEPAGQYGISLVGDAASPAREWELPPQYAARLAAFMRELGLVHACVDLALDTHGALQFLGVDARAHGLGVEERVPQLPVLRALCALLAQGRADYDLDATADVSLAQWRDTGRAPAHAVAATTTSPEQAYGR